MTKINKEIKKHNQELEKNKGQIEEISETEQKQVLAKKASLQKKAEEFNQLLLSKEEDYKTSLTAQKNTKKLVNELSAKAEKYSQQLHIQSNELSRQRQALSKRKLLQQALAEEEILLQQIKEKINTETQNISKLRHSENQLNTAVEKQKISFSEQLVQTIEQFKSKLELEGKKKLESLAKVIEDERKKSVILHNESKNKERMIEEEITAQEAKLQEFRKRAAVDFSQLKEDRLRTIREGMDRKLKQLNQDIKTEEEELQELKIRLQKEEMVLKEKIISKKNEFEEEKTLLQNKIGLINSKTASSNLAIREVQARMKELNEKSSSLSSRISSAQDKKKVMEERLNRHDKDLLALNDIVKRKLHSINEIKILKEEIKQLHLILNNKLRKGKVKLNIIKLIKTVPVRSAQEMKPALKTIDELLGKLPAEEIDDFAKSKEFTTYKKIMNKYGVK
ncbi:hypothetical protein J4437_06435 [Candidatus Woesearchaeota archaeon]|nr:hypothetical protein [Candidatus Woesearchaeota archaeon]